MSSQKERDDSNPYRPTSLDFINLPNPIQPAPQLQKHPLNGTPRLEKARLESTPAQDLFQHILDHPTERPSKRPKRTENPNLDLPKLPVRKDAKRNRLPPTLSGLHQPPPNAGLLPSISTEQPEVPPPRSIEIVLKEPAQVAAEKSATAKKSSSKNVDSTPPAKEKLTNKSGEKRSKRNKWNDAETKYLLKGVERFGIGSWTKILNCDEYTFNKRTAPDLKDRFRVCCPELSKRTKMPKYSKASRYDASGDGAESASERPHVRGTVPERVSSAAMKKFGVTEPFVKVDRRTKHEYTQTEDEALLKGFQKYGTSWKSIRNDALLGLQTREPRDLRDRMRMRYPEAYVKAGLVPRAAKKLLTTSARDNEPHAADEGGDTSMNNVLEKDISAPTKIQHPSRPSIFSWDDLYLGPLGMHDDGEDMDNEPITLDRGILDWAQADNGNTSNSSRPPAADSSRTYGINPMMTLNLPKPNGHPSSSSTVLPHPASTSNSNNTTSLPSLSTLLPPDGTDSDQMELPSLMQWYGGTVLPTLDEILG